MANVSHKWHAQVLTDRSLVICWQSFVHFTSVVLITVFMWPMMIFTF